MLRSAIFNCQNSNGTVKIYFDEQESATLSGFITSSKGNIKTFARFRQLVFEGNRNRYLYSPKKICKECDNLYAIHFTSGRNQNDRLYCLEFRLGARIIVLCRVYENKRTQKINKRLKESIRPICNWKYKF